VSGEGLKDVIKQVLLSVIIATVEDKYLKFKINKYY